MERHNVVSDQVIRIVPKSPVREHRIVDGPKRWVVIDPFPHHRGHRVEWQIMDTAPHQLEIDPPDAVNPGTLKIDGNYACADIYAGADRGYQEYYVTVDGQPAEGGSAPGIIIE